MHTHAKFALDAIFPQSLLFYTSEHHLDRQIMLLHYNNNATHGYCPPPTEEEFSVIGYIHMTGLLHNSTFFI